MTESDKEKQNKILEYLNKKFKENPDYDIDDETIAKDCNLDKKEAKGLCILMAQDGLIDHTESAGKFRFYKINSRGRKELEKLENLDDSNIQSYRLLKNLEQEMRRFIEKELSENNQKWWKQLIPGDVKNNAEERKKDDEERKTWKFKEQPLISYINFTDYEKIITQKNNWEEIFHDVFHDKIAISGKLKEIEPIRNAISHTRNLDSYEEKQLRFYSEEILRTISYYYDNKEKIKEQKAKKKIEKEVPSVPISVSFDKTVYPISSKVYARANVPTIIDGKPIIFQVYNSQNKLLLTREVDPIKYENQELKALGLYETSFVMESEDWKVGEKFLLKAIHGSSEAYDETTIDQRIPVIQSDKSVYLWGTDMILTVIDPDADKDSNKPEFVGDRSDSKLIIKSSKDGLENYRLRETGDSTGIFQGIIGFIGIRNNGNIEPYRHNGKLINKTQGKEVDDGFLIVSEDDELKITYSNLKGTAELSVFVIHSPEASQLGF